MRYLVILGIALASLALVCVLSMLGCTEVKQDPAQEVGKFIGFIPGHKGEWGVSVYEHEGNLIYVYRGYGIAVVPKRSEK